MADTISTATTATFPTSARSSADIVNAGIQPIFRSTIVEDPTEPPTPEPAVRPSLSWKSFRSSISVSEKTMAQLGWIIAFLSVLLTIVALSPAFKSQNASEKALRIAEWTALKDFIEECREELAAGIHSQACVRAMNTTLPPPPYATSGLFDRIKRGTMTRHEENNGTARAVHIDYRAGELKLVVQWLIFCAICLTACGFLFINFEHNRSHISRNRRQLYADTAWKGLQADDITHSRPSIESNPTTIAAIRHPPPSADANLRRRAIRRHPIYRYSNLEEAIHHSDMTEIRARLCNGEDVNEHWPYLIYRLAISPPSSETEKRIEVARLCLDFGADVNALKGWNGQSALMIAIHFGNVAVAKLLIANGATVCYSPPDTNLTALHRCVRLAVAGSAKDSLEIMNALFAHGANANQMDRANETALHKLMIDAWFARHDEESMKKLYPIARCLVENGAILPTTINKKYVNGNPLWHIINSGEYVDEWPENVGTDHNMVLVGGGWVKKRDIVPRNNSSHGLGSER